MSGKGSVTHWLQLLQTGDHQAAQPLWERYCRKLEVLVSKKLRGRSFGAQDAEDVALSAFTSFCQALEREQFPQLSDRSDLWRLLIVITARKTAHLLRDQDTQKRGAAIREDVAIEQVVGEEPTPEFAAQAMEEYERLLGRLQREDLKQIAIWKMDGYTNQEIADKLGCAVRTVDRKLRLIRRIWERETEP